MTMFAIKVIAILTMVVDHIGFFYFRDQMIFRAVGRISFPLFAWLIANGAKHTKDINKYLVRLLMFAIVSQPFYIASLRFVNPTIVRPNVLFTLFLGLLAIKLIEENGKRPIIQVVYGVIMAVIAQLSDSEYGTFGVVSILVFYLFFDNMRLLVVAQTFLYTVGVAIFMGLGFLPVGDVILLMPLGIFSLIPVYLYNNKSGPKKAKYLFYIFYPLQFAIFYLLGV